jgi:hypothetical protein
MMGTFVGLRVLLPRSPRLVSSACERISVGDSAYMRSSIAAIRDLSIYQKGVSVCSMGYWKMLRCDSHCHVRLCRQTTP